MGSTTATGKATSMAHELDNLDVDLSFLELVMQDADGGTVEFTVKELLQDIRTQIDVVREEGRDRPTKEDFGRLERRVENVEMTARASEIKFAKLAGALGVGGVLGGGVGAAIASIFGLG